eukprot:gene32142-16667_t
MLQIDAVPTVDIPSCPVRSPGYLTPPILHTMHLSCQSQFVQSRPAALTRSPVVVTTPLGRGPLLRATNRVRCRAADDEARKANMEKVPMGDLPKPHPRAMASMATMNKNQAKSGWQKFLVDSLDGVSFTVVGDDTALNLAFAEALGDKLGWLPVQSSKVVCGMNKVKTPEELPKEKLGMSRECRVVLSTIAGGAAYEPDSYKHMWGNFIVWIDEDDMLKPKSAKLPHRELFAKNTEIQLLLKKGKGFGKS